MMKNNLFPVAKEGWNKIGFSFLAFAIAYILDADFLQFIFFLMTLFLVYVYRNPERLAPHFQAGSVVSPVDGIVSAIEEIEEGEYSYKITVDTGFLDVSVLRAPSTSQVVEASLVHGTRLSSRHKLSEKLNENTTIVFQDAHENKIKVVHTLKQSFDALHINVLATQELAQGTRYGVMVYGSTTIYLPQNFRMDIKLGDEISASDTLIGYFSKK
jgi:phosphatidylserine decarboxylase